MRTSQIKPGERVKDLHFSENSIIADLMDGQIISVPLAWYPRLLHASPQQRQIWTLAGGRSGIHWPVIDEDLSTEGMLIGASAPRKTIPNVA